MRKQLATLVVVVTLGLGSLGVGTATAEVTAPPPSHDAEVDSGPACWIREFIKRLFTD